MTTQRSLEVLGYNVLVAAGPAEAEALAAGHAEPIHLLITDAVMPGMSGRDLAARLREGRPEMKCLFVSGYSTNVALGRGGLESGAQFLPKPFSRAALARRVRDLLDA